MSKAVSFCLLRTDLIIFGYKNTFFFIKSWYSSIDYGTLSCLVGCSIFLLMFFSVLKIILRFLTANDICSKLGYYKTDYRSFVTL